MIQQDLFGSGTPLSKCSIAQAMSALVKSVRLRHTEDAAYWYLHVATCFPKDYFRLYRRMFIIGAEDCIDPAIQRQMYEWYKLAMVSKDRALINKLAVHLIQRICSTENWWQSPSGQKYILGWRLTEKASKAAGDLPNGMKDYFRSAECSTEIVTIATSNSPLGIRTEKALYLHFHGCANGMNRAVYASKLVDAAIQSKNLQARMTAQAHVAYAKQLGNMDENWLAQALWRLLGHPLEAKTISTPGDLDALYNAKLQEVFEASRIPPAWTQDGVHCSGKDRRFAGLLSSMVACCNVFNAYNYLDPSIEFKDKHYSSDLLKEKHGELFQD
jgi:hypothetical protein